MWKMEYSVALINELGSHVHYSHSTVFQRVRSNVVATNAPQSLDILHTHAIVSPFILLTVPEFNKCDDTHRIFDSAAKIGGKICVSDCSLNHVLRLDLL